MQYAVVVGVFGLALALGFGLLMTLGDPFEPLRADFGGVLFRTWISALHDLRPLVIDLVHQFARVYL
jgi:hypothetical protein